MMAAMMLPSAAPMVLLSPDLDRAGPRAESQPFVRTWVFALSSTSPSGRRTGCRVRPLPARHPFDLGSSPGTRRPYVAGGAVVAAGLSELTPLKASACAVAARRSTSSCTAGARASRRAADGGRARRVLVGCCWGLMIVFFALGVMSLVWMAIVAALIFFQKVLPRGRAAHEGVCSSLRGGGSLDRVRPRLRSGADATELGRGRARPDADDARAGLAGHEPDGRGESDAAVETADDDDLDDVDDTDDEVQDRRRADTNDPHIRNARRSRCLTEVGSTICRRASF